MPEQLLYHGHFQLTPQNARPDIHCLPHHCRESITDSKIRRRANITNNPTSIKCSWMKYFVDHAYFCISMLFFFNEGPKGLLLGAQVYSEFYSIWGWSVVCDETNISGRGTEKVGTDMSRSKNKTPLRRVHAKNILNICLNRGDKLLCFYTNVAFENIRFRAFFRAFSFAWTRTYLWRNLLYRNLIHHS